MPAVEDAPAEVEAATTALSIAHAEAAADALTIEHAVEAATVLAATAHAIAPIEEAAPRSVRAIGLLEAVPALADTVTVSVLALESIQNTDPVIAYSLVVESSNELHIKVAQTTRGGCFCSVQHHTCGGGFYCSRFKSIADLWTKLLGLDFFCRLQESFHGSCQYSLLMFLVWCCFQLCPLVDTLRGCSVLTDGCCVSWFKFQLLAVIRVKI